MPGLTLGHAFNRTRNVRLATQVRFAQSHWSRFRGLMWTDAVQFGPGSGLWIVPSRGIHTFAMRFAIDAVYLSREGVVVHLVTNLQPWRIAAVNMRAASVLELPASTLHATGTRLGDEIEIAVGQAREAVTA
jgi:uncharacterized membrane protein (UPF0127 family)